MHNYIEEIFLVPKEGNEVFQERYPGQGPNFQPRGPFHQQQRPMIQRMPNQNRPFMQQRPQQPQMGRQANGPIQQTSNKMGLLSKLFGKSKQNPQNLFTPPSGMKKETRSSGGILDTLKNPEGLNTMLNNTQRVLQAAEQFTPMIQQYGPIVKNLPSIWKMMRAINSNDTKKEKTESKNESKNESKQLDSSDIKSGSKKKTNQHPPKKKSESVPKLYI